MKMPCAATISAECRAMRGSGFAFLCGSAGEEQRRELFLAKVVGNDLVAVLAKHFRRGCRDGVVKTAWTRVGEEE